MANRAGIRPQPPYQQTIHVVAQRDDRAKTYQKPCSSCQYVDETVQKLTEPESAIQSQTIDRHILCQNPVHAATRRATKATRILPCSHTFCDYCYDLDRAIIGGYVHCINCKKQCRLQDIVKIETGLHKDNIDTKSAEHTGTQEKANISKRCNYTSCQQKQVDTYEIILLSCNHRFCHQCFSNNIRPEFSTEGYICIKCPNCEDDERWYADGDVEPYLVGAGENYDHYKRLKASKESFVDEIKCIIKQTLIYLEIKIWKNKDELTIKVWSALRECVHLQYSIQPNDSGLYTVEIPIETDIYFFKISRLGKRSNISGTQWFGPVELEQGKQPNIEGNIEIDHISSNSVQLSWAQCKPYKYISVSGCSIEKWSAINGVWEPSIFVKHNIQRCTIENLTEKTQYTFRLVWHTSVGDIECSHCDVETKPGTAKFRGTPYTPNDFAIKYNGINKGLFTWKEPPYILTNKVLKYILEIKEGDGNWVKVGEVEKECWINCPFQKMKDDKIYYFRIAACNSFGRSEPCELGRAIRRKPCTIPQPANFRLDKDVHNRYKLFWDPPSGLKENHSIEYIVEIKEEHSTKWSEVEKTNNFWIMFPYSKMKTYRGYHFQVATTNAKERSVPVALPNCLFINKAYEPQEIKEKDKKTNDISASQSETDKEKDKKKNDNSASQCPTAKEIDNKTNAKSASQCQDGKEKDKKTNDNSEIQCSTDKKKDKMTNENSASQCETDKEKDKKTNDNSESQCSTGKEKDKKTNGNLASQNQTGKDNGNKTNKNSARECQTGKEKDKKTNGNLASQNQTGKDNGKKTNKNSARECQTGKHEDIKKEEELCSKCRELKPMECILSCKHKYCLECSFDLSEHAMECFDGRYSVFMWDCKSCETMTEEKFVEFTGTILNKNTFTEARKHCEQQKPKAENGPGNSISNDKSDVGTKEKIRGLPNVGMTCYSNCIFQILAQTHCFYNHLEALVMEYNLDKTKSVTGLLLRTLSEINRESGDEWSNRVDYDTVVRLIETISQSDQSFQRGEQADCHSFMMALFNKIKDEIQITEERSDKSKTGQTSKQNPSESEGKKNKVEPAERTCSLTRDTRGMLVEKQAKRNKEKPLFQFEGYTTNVFFYDSCPHKEVTDRQLFNSLLIPIEDKMFSNWTLCEGLEVLQKRETFSENLVPCGICNIGNQRSSWWKNTTKIQIFTQLPNVLVLQLGKFEKGYYVPVRKIHAKVEYPHKLKLKEYNDQDAEWQFSEKTYRLYGVTLHSGTIYGGHYSAYVRCKDNETPQSQSRDDAQWFYCSDSYVQKESEEKVINDPKASVLFYELINSEYHT